MPLETFQSALGASHFGGPVSSAWLAGNGTHSPAMMAILFVVIGVGLWIVKTVWELCSQALEPLEARIDRMSGLLVALRKRRATRLQRLIALGECDKDGNMFSASIAEENRSREDLRYERKNKRDDGTLESEHLLRLQQRREDDDIY